MVATKTSGFDILTSVTEFHLERDIKATSLLKVVPPYRNRWRGLNI